MAQQFIAVLLAESTLQFALQDLKSFQQTVDIAQTQYQSGFISEGDFAPTDRLELYVTSD